MTTIVEGDVEVHIRPSAAAPDMVCVTIVAPTAARVWLLADGLPDDYRRCGVVAPERTHDGRWAGMVRLVPK